MNEDNLVPPLCVLSAILFIAALILGLLCARMEGEVDLMKETVLTQKAFIKCLRKQNEQLLERTKQ